MSKGATFLIAILFAALAVAITRSCQVSCPDLTDSLVTYTDSITVTIFDTISISSGVDGEEVTLRKKSLSRHSASLIDTAAVIEDYLSRKVYSATYQDTNITMEISPVIVENEIDSIGIAYSLMIPETTHIITRDKVLPPEKWAFYLGAGLAAGPDQLITSPMIQANYEDRLLIGIGYSPSETTGGVQFSMMYKIFSLR